MSARWRLLLDGPGAGPWNMAVDEALLRSAQRGAPPTLRFYSWDGAWLSLGFAQPLDAARRAACREAGVGIVRRATGGRAVLHGADLTYAVAAPAAALPAGLHATYALIGEALRQGLAALGIAAERSAARARRRRGPGGFDCFQSPAADELCAGGRKLAGSAQRRAGGGVLQHGSLRLGPDPAGRARGRRASRRTAPPASPSSASRSAPSRSARPAPARSPRVLPATPRARATLDAGRARAGSRAGGPPCGRARSAPSPGESQESPSPADNYMRRGITPITCHA